MVLLFAIIRVRVYGGTMDKKLLILLVLFGMRGTALIASEPPSSLSDENESPSSFLSEAESPSTSPQEAKIREKSVIVLKRVHAPAVPSMPLDSTVATLIKQADVPRNEINNFLDGLSDTQIQLLNKIVSYNRTGAQLFFFPNEKTTYNTFPVFVRRLFKKSLSKQSDETVETEEY